jgi:hypothetical protein
MSQTVALLKAKLPLDSLVHDKSIYPRSMVNWKTSQTYYRAMLSGARFPAIVVTTFRGKTIIVDGVHRCNALRLFFKKKNLPLTSTVEVEIIECKTLKEAFLEAIKRNVTHGRQLSLYEKMEIYRKLKSDMETSQIANLLNMETAYLKKLAKQRITMIGSKDVTLKSTFASLDKTKLIISKEAQVPFTGDKQIKLIDQILSILKEGWLDLNNKNVTKKLVQLKDWLDTMDI